MVYSIKRQEKVTMNFEGSPQCGNAGDMKFQISVEGRGYDLDNSGFVFDSAHLARLFMQLKKGKWHGSCEGIGLYCSRWLYDADPGVASATVTITTESTNVLSITTSRYDLDKEWSKLSDKAIKRPA